MRHALCVVFTSPHPKILIAIEADGLVGDAWVPGVEGPRHSGGPSYVPLLLLLLSITV